MVNAQFCKGQSKAFLEKSILNYKKQFPDDHFRLAHATGQLGNVYKSLGETKRARGLLEKNLFSFENHFGKNHIELAPVLRDLGLVYLQENDIEAAEKYIKQSLEIFEREHHPESYSALEGLGIVYYEKYKKQRELKYEEQAMNYLNKALQVARNNFPNYSAHIARIDSHIKKAGKKK